MKKKLPNYLLIEQDIINQIQSGTLMPGDQILTESQLCGIYKVSRMTVNKALASLANKGFINRTPGKGTFVSEPKVTKIIGKNTSFTNDIRSINKTPGAILLDYRVIRASSDIYVSKKLTLNSDELIHSISRIRTSDGIRIALSNTFIPCKYLPALDVNILEGSIYEYLDKEFNLHPVSFDYSFSSVLPNKQQKELLQIDSCALLKVCHCSSAENIPFFEYTETYYAGNRYTYKFHPETIS
ncbi:GntR family transcriptional regulator [Petroclostridium sp. X23]|uniref:GntR family transcriptional regulator n=1 Tax=Petroclostridium sp. X23 TaxID=3045146 RepID=UPI0024ADDE5F|nr:GntR family transcriptional regulator [Petroclostridium sp. X23]WHH57157.1 GntR family transcriptional regulator [Petroclostridium sp. X23]